MSDAYPLLRHSEPRLAYSPFGPLMVPGPFADDYTNLKWEFKEHRDGETARFRVGGLEVYVQDDDGDRSWWELRDLRRKRREWVIAEGTHASIGTIPDFWKCLVDAERALRAEVLRRVRALRQER